MYRLEPRQAEINKGGNRTFLSSTSSAKQQWVLLNNREYYCRAGVLSECRLEVVGSSEPAIMARHIILLITSTHGSTFLIWNALITALLQKWGSIHWLSLHVQTVRSSTKNILQPLKYPDTPTSFGLLNGSLLYAEA